MGTGLRCRMAALHKSLGTPECLDRMVLLGEAHLRRAVTQHVGTGRPTRRLFGSASRGQYAQRAAFFSESGVAGEAMSACSVAAIVDS